MRIGILCLMQESNTFLNQQTKLHHFAEDLLLVGEEIRKQLANTHHEVAGFFAGLEKEGLEAVPLFAARAIPYGTIQKEAFEQLLENMFKQVEQAGPLDGYLVAPHGATVSEQHLDADGYWLKQLRERVGAEIPIIGTLDLHANLSSQMVASTNALIAYRTNPHLDQYARGFEAAELMSKTLRGEVEPVQRAAFLPFVMNIEKQCTELSPCKELYELAEKLRRKKGLLLLSILQGYPYADVDEMGTSILAVSDKTSLVAEQTLAELSNYLWEHRADFNGTGVPIDQAIDSLKNDTRSTCLLDMGDNVGGGSPADGTLIAQALLSQRVRDSFVCLYDPEAVLQAEDAGLGAELKLAMGGKTDRLHGDPLIAWVEVIGIYPGKFEEPLARHGGFTHFDQGLSAVVRSAEGLIILLTSKRMAPYSLEQLRSCGLDPGSFRVLVAKGVNAPIAAYEEVCSRFIRVDTPGVTASNLNHFYYHHRRRPMFPFERDLEWSFVRQA